MCSDIRFPHLDIYFGKRSSFLALNQSSHRCYPNHDKISDDERACTEMLPGVILDRHFSLPGDADRRITPVSPQSDFLHWTSNARIWWKNIITYFRNYYYDTFAKRGIRNWEKNIVNKEIFPFLQQFSRKKLFQNKLENNNLILIHKVEFQ